MAKTLSQSELIELLTRSVRQELMSELAPTFGKLAQAAGELQTILAGDGRRRRGRRPGSTAAEAPASRGPRRKGNAPRGALKATVMEILQKTGKPISLSDIVAQVMKTPDFKGRNEKSIYNKVNADLSKAPEVVRVEKGVYQLKK